MLYLVVHSVSLLVLQIMLANRLDEDNHFKYTAITVPLYISLLTLILLSFGAKGGNQCKYLISSYYILNNLEQRGVTSASVQCLFSSLFTLVLLSFGAKGGNQCKYLISSY
jgi:hypothetical protein